MKEFLSLLFHFRKRELFILPTNNGFVQFFRFIFVGGIATLTDLFSTTFCYETLGLRTAHINLFGFDAGLLIASTVGFVLGLVVNYVLSVLWIFRSENINRVKEFTAFTVIGLIGLGVKLLAVAIMERYIFDLHTPLFGFLLTL